MALHIFDFSNILFNKNLLASATERISEMLQVNFLKINFFFAVKFERK